MGRPISSSPRSGRDGAIPRSGLLCNVHGHNYGNAVYMPAMNAPQEFEWDDEKSAKNEAERGIPFEAAVDVFLDEHRLEWIDARKDYGEVRRVMVGVVDGVCLSVAYTMRGEAARIISVRCASRKERRQYGYHP